MSDNFYKVLGVDEKASKEEIKKRLGRSTNLADAIVMVSDVPSLYTSSFI